jgi:hypothetical protein
MKRVAILTFVALVAWQLYAQFRSGSLASLVPPKPATASAAPAAPVEYACDQRTHCAQMTSCAEAKYFQKNCRNADLEQDDAGVPCARRWCTSPNAP